MHLTDEDFNKTLRAIATDPSMRAINLRFFELTAEHIITLMSALQQNQNVHTLDLGVTFIHQPRAKTESTQLADAEQLNNEAASDNIKNAERMFNCEATCIILADYLRNHNHVEKLALYHNHYGDLGVTHLLSALQANSGIYILDLKANDLTDAIIPSVLEFIANNASIELIDLSYNNFSQDGRRRLAAASNANCAILVKSLQNSPEITAIPAKKDKVQFPFKYIPIDRNKPMTKKRAKARFELRDKVKHLIIANPDKDIYPQIIKAYQSKREENPNLIIFDVLKVLNQLKVPLVSAEHACTIRGFILHCMQNEGLINQLLANILASPKSLLRDQALEIIGHEYYVRFDPEAVYTEQKFYKLVAYICFKNIDSPNASLESLTFQIYRSILNQVGIKPYNEASAQELADFHNQQPEPLFNLIKELKTIDQIWEATADFETLLFEYKQRPGSISSNADQSPNTFQQYAQPKLD